MEKRTAKQTEKNSGLNSVKGKAIAIHSVRLKEKCLEKMMDLG